MSAVRIFSGDRAILVSHIVGSEQAIHVPDLVNCLDGAYRAVRNSEEFTKCMTDPCRYSVHKYIIPRLRPLQGKVSPLVRMGKCLSLVAIPIQGWLADKNNTD